jgi:hypothetical protein
MVKMKNEKMMFPRNISPSTPGSKNKPSKKPTRSRLSVNRLNSALSHTILSTVPTVHHPG